jgi:hypothetical protein
VINQDPEIGPMTMTGKVALDGEIINADGNANINAGLNGDIATTGDGPDETVTFDGGMIGEFLGEKAEGAVGELQGRFIHGGNEEDVTYLKGTWGAETADAQE